MSYRKTSPANPQAPNNDQPIDGTLSTCPALFVGEATAEFSIMTVVTTEVEACFVVADIVVGGTTIVVSTVDTGVEDSVVRTAGELPLDTVVVTVAETNTTLSVEVIVDSGIVVAGTVVAGKVVVKVRVTLSPRSLAGIAVPTPADVN